MITKTVIGSKIGVNNFIPAANKKVAPYGATFKIQAVMFMLLLDQLEHDGA